MPSSDDDSVPAGGSLDPRSIKIAGASVAAIVIAGLVASNMAEPEARPERLVPARVEPGAAAVEQAEAEAECAGDPPVRIALGRTGR